MDEAQELEELRRLEALEQRAAATQPVTPPPAGGSFGQGFGAGLRESSRGLGNIAAKALSVSGIPGTGSLLSPFDAPGPVSNKAVREEQARNKGVDESRAGWWGKLAGAAVPQVALSAATAGTGSLPAAGANALARTLAGGVGRSALEGAIGSAAMADPDKQLQAAGEGAVGGVVVNRLGKAGGRVLKGLVEKSDAAKDLIHFAGQQGEKIFLPLSQAADEAGDTLTKTMRMVYREALPLIPGVTGKMKSQQMTALGTVRDMALREADVTGNVIKEGAGAEGLVARRALKQALDKEYQDTIKSYAFNLPQDFRAQVAQRIKKDMPNVDRTTLVKVADLITNNAKRFSNGKLTVDGTNLLNAKNATSRAWRTLQGPEKEALSSGVKIFDEIIENDLKQGGSARNLEDLARYKALAEPYKAFTQLSRAIGAAKKTGGDFTPAQLAGAAKDQSTLGHLGVTANRVLGQPIAQPSTAGRVAAYSLGALGGYHNPAALAGVVGGANLLATKKGQEFLMGDTALQTALVNALRKNPEAAMLLGQTGRAGLATQIGEEER